MIVEYTAEQQKIQPQLAAANINPDSFLATDYLNHFNEIVMLMEMIPDMPELIEEAIEWAPKTYDQHFEESGFQAKDLAIEAYKLAPPVFKTPFEKTCDEMQGIIQSTLNGLVAVNVVERGMSPAAQQLIRGRIENLQSHLMILNQLIHGKIEDAPPAPQDEAPQEEVQSQEDIDKLFD
ncbi:MAG: hypothetical protein JJ850_12985 [Kordiimonadaceae bacterium]|nr:hypothetical protein [Kordiimonadaceae bacterium]MBO6570370.1 hypothetical protein [Kordiimonadaceae bacterium]MBO6965532.1 hypothetical protein [Kordiimonadaceae bacterium]